MSQENAKKVALGVIEAVGKGRKPEKTKLAEQNGYSKESARAGKATQTKTYKETIKPFLDKLEAERDRIIDSLGKKDLTVVEYDKLMGSLDKAVKNLQLLQGKPTENTNFTLEDDKKNIIDKALEGIGRNDTEAGE